MGNAVPTCIVIQRSGGLACKARSHIVVHTVDIVKTICIEALQHIPPPRNLALPPQTIRLWSHDRSPMMANPSDEDVLTMVHFLSADPSKKAFTARIKRLVDKQGGHVEKLCGFWFSKRD